MHAIRKPRTAPRTITKGIRATPEFFAKARAYAVREGMTPNAFIVNSAWTYILADAAKRPKKAGA